MESLADHVRCSTVISWDPLCIYPLPLFQAVFILSVCVCVYTCTCVNAVHVCCVWQFRVPMLTVGHDNTSRCICVLCTTLFHDLIAYSGSWQQNVCVCTCTCVLQGWRSNVLKSRNTCFVLHHRMVMTKLKEDVYAMGTMEIADLRDTRKCKNTVHSLVAVDQSEYFIGYSLGKRCF